MSELIDRASKEIAFMEINSGIYDPKEVVRWVLAAIKEPTDAMERAFELQGTKRHNFKLMWNAAIEEALK